jgi:hypothetical protein
MTALGRHRGRLTLGSAVAMVLVLAGSSEGRRGGFCSQTARLLFDACKAESKDDGLVGKAICINIADAAAREACLDELKTAREEGRALCRKQRDGRLETCGSLGEGRYDPEFSPARFDDPENPSNPNPYFPLGIGNTWEYRGGDEVNTIEVVNETKLMPGGVRCIVFRDLVMKGGELAEATDDWFTPAKDGNVWYCGEEVKNFESFDGDDPRRPELVSIDGSFKAGRDHDKPGIIFLASPTPGAVYVEEFSLGNAEDVTQVLSTTYAFGSDPELDQGVPQQLTERLCTGDCVVTKNFSLLEPGVFARKYHARGIGVFLEVEVDPETGELGTVQLVNCNFDPRCVGLPTP